MANDKDSIEFKRVKVTTERGTGVYPRLGTPDTKFNALGVYSVRQRMSPELAAPLMTQIDALQEERFQFELAKLEAAGEKAKAKKLKKTDKPYKPALDKDGEETGDIEFNWKMVAQYKDRKTQQMKTRTPVVVDSKGKKIDGNKVWGGSELKVGGYLSTFSTAIGVGVSLKLAQVAIYKLVTGGSDTFNFGNEEGYEAPEDDEVSSSTTSSATSGDASGEPDEF